MRGRARRAARQTSCSVSRAGLRERRNCQKRRERRTHRLAVTLLEHLERLENGERAQVRHDGRVDERPGVVDEVVTDEGRGENDSCEWKRESAS